ncbi:MAG TPA: cellulose-binding protein [Ktedonobacteraceae bacterium]|jgi:hypothetical protein|nr:cellulose-binding protein [Ktedonobacteraceae bacterium]
MKSKQLMYPRQHRRWQNWIGAFLLVCALLLITGTAPAYADTSATSAQVTVNLHQTLSTLSPTAIGVNDAVWDSNNLLDPALPGLLRADGVKIMRYPGGSTSDVYHWQSNTVVPNMSYAAPSNTFDAFMGVVHATGAQAMITINYGSGTPQEAAGWVQYANEGGPNYNGPVPTYAGGSSTGHRYGVKYWEIGNEVYGNSTYGGNWEYDLNPPGPASYANNFVAYSKAMKAVDPSIKIGLVLTTPGNWPDGVTSATSPQPWNDTVLPIACSSADFVILHWYPQGPTGESDAGLLGAPANGESTPVSYTPSIPSMISTVRSELNEYCGAHASDVQIMVTETNSVSYNPGKQTTSLVNALYLAEDYMTWLQNGVANVDWWDVHNGITTGTNNSSSLYGTTDYGDYGLLSSGGSSGGISEPPAETPFPAYYGLQIVSKVVSPFGRIVATTSSQSLVQAFAVRRWDGSIAVLLVNTDPSTTYDVTLSGLNCAGFGNATVYSYGENSTSVSVTYEHGRDAGSQVLAPYSLTAVVFH